jgi:hypothetical protein
MTADDNATIEDEQIGLAAGADEGGQAFEHFMLAEYDHISGAHFSTVASISSFFQYYLIIVSLPITALAIVSKIVNQDSTTSNPLHSYGPLLTPVFFIVGIVGLLVLGYMSNLRLDAILYARQVNGIREFFYSRSHLSSEEESVVRLLPRAIDLPAYLELRYFGFVVFALGLVDSAYVFGAFYLPGVRRTASAALWALAAVFFLIHFVVYGILCRYRRKAYLQ